MKRILVSLAVVATCLAATIAPPPWLLAKSGHTVFTSAGEEDSPTTPICPTVALYRAYVNENGAKGCVEHPMGIKVVIEAVIPAARNLGAIAKVRSESGAFEGYTAVTELLPPIPQGVAVTLEPAANETLTLSPQQGAQLGQGLQLGTHVSAVIMRFDPKNADKRDLQVRVTSGKYARRLGWVFARQAFFKGLPLDTLVVP